MDTLVKERATGSHSPKTTETVTTDRTKPKQTGAGLVVRALESQGVTHVWGIPGAKIDAVFNCTASENTVPVPCEFAYAIWTSWQRSCDRDDQVLMQRGDRVGNVTLGPDRRRRGVGNYREWQVF